MCGVLSLLPLFFACIFLLPALLARALPLTSLCGATPNASLCLSTLCSYPQSQPSAALPDLTAFVVSSALAQVNSSYAIAKGLAQEDDDTDRGGGDNSWSTLGDCLELMDACRDGLQSCLQALVSLDVSAPPASVSEQVMDVRVRLSASLTDLDTCWDELAEPAAAALSARLQQVGQVKAEPLLSMALTMAQTLQQPGGVNASYGMTCRRHHIRRHAAPAPLSQ